MFIYLHCITFSIDLKTTIKEAIARGSISHIKKLLKQTDMSIDGLLYNFEENTTLSALMVASLSGQSKVAQLLLEKGASVSVKDYTGSTALMYAIKKGHHKVVKILLEKHPGQQNLESALLLASENGYCETVKLLLKKGAQVDRLSLINACKVGNMMWSNFCYKMVHKLTCRQKMEGLH